MFQVKIYDVLIFIFRIIIHWIVNMVMTTILRFMTYIKNLSQVSPK